MVAYYRTLEEYIHAEDLEELLSDEPEMVRDGNGYWTAIGFPCSVDGRPVTPPLHD